jgi:hypothetical protein
MARKFVNTSTHPVDTLDGGIVAPGETITLKEMDDHTQTQVDAGLLVEVEDPKADKGGKN